MSEPVRLQVYLARRGLGSRRHCEQFIREGRVTVNGQRATLGCSVTESDKVRLDGESLPRSEALVHLAVHKPPGYLCANEDPRGRPLVADLLAGVGGRLYHVGRLDLQSSGLIFYTNDGHFARTVMHPSSQVEKDYLVETREPVTTEQLTAFQRGIVLGGERYRLQRFEQRSPRRVLLTLVEGKNREIRLVFEHFGLRLRSIHRVRIGCVRLTGIPKGAYRTLSAAEVRWFTQRAAGAGGHPAAAPRPAARAARRSVHRPNPGRDAKPSRRARRPNPGPDAGRRARPGPDGRSD